MCSEAPPWLILANAGRQRGVSTDLAINPSILARYVGNMNELTDRAILAEAIASRVVAVEKKSTAITLCTIHRASLCYSVTRFNGIPSIICCISYWKIHLPLRDCEILCLPASIGFSWCRFLHGRLSISFVVLNNLSHISSAVHTCVFLRLSMNSYYYVDVH